eukprot:TRINITY_DN4586_c0_g1_i1.p1 TRINITY_DN4586_c0_g1~~TRINITY_DN4586_c0_g1_i1.p1  ORF type:complete len:917 (-),score=137.23 TRINITY_DN4586_c0_g1_i1:3-2753(-)
MPGCEPSEEEQHAFLELAKTADFPALRKAVSGNRALINVQPCGRWSALHQVAYVGDPETLQFLLDNRADVNATTRDGETALDVARCPQCKVLLSSKERSRREIAPGAPGDPWRGLSVHYLTTVLKEELARYGFTLKSTIHEIEPGLIRRRGQDVVCPRDGLLGAAYVDAVEGAEYVGRATQMLSYTWNYSVGDIIEGLAGWCRRNKTREDHVRVWICCFCVNQHRVQNSNVSFEEFRNVFRSRLTGIGHVLALLGSWKVPAYTTRVWCVFELHTAIELQSRDPSKCTLEIILASGEEELFRNDLIDGNGLDHVWKALSGINVEAASASFPQDKERILQLVREGPGYIRLNKEIVSHFHNWFTASSEGYLRNWLASGFVKDVRTALACARVGELLERISKFGRAGELAEHGVAIVREVNAENTLVHAMLLRILGSSLRHSDRERAQACYMRAEQIHNECEEETAEYAQLLQRAGILHGDCGDLEQELSCHTVAYEDLQFRSEENTRMGADLLRSIGMVHQQRAEYEKALIFFNRARETHARVGSLATPEGASALESIGEVYSLTEPPNWQMALHWTEEAYTISVQLGLDTTRRAVKLIERLASIHEHLGHSKEHKKWTKLGDNITRAHDTLTPCAASPLASAIHAGQILSLSAGWEVYFEVVTDKQIEKTVKTAGFPLSFGPFRTSPTVKILPQDLSLRLNCLNGMSIREGAQWTLSTEALQRSPALQHLVGRSRGGSIASVSSAISVACELEGKLEGAVKGSLSPPQAVNLSEAERERLQIPSNVQYFMFSHPTSGVSSIRMPSSDDPDVAFLSNGGFVYLGENMTDIVAISALLDDSSGSFQFGPPRKWEAEWTRNLFDKGRFVPVTSEEYWQRGATHFCWILPGEITPREGPSICPFGGVAFVHRPSVEEIVSV